MGQGYFIFIHLLRGLYNHVDSTPQLTGSCRNAFASLGDLKICLCPPGRVTLSVAGCSNTNSMFLDWSSFLTWSNSFLRFTRAGLRSRKNITGVPSCVTGPLSSRDRSEATRTIFSRSWYFRRRIRTCLGLWPGSRCGPSMRCARSMISGSPKCSRPRISGIQLAKYFTGSVPSQSSQRPTTRILLCLL